MSWPVLVAFGCPLLVSWLLTALLIRWAPRLGLVDHPAARKVHTRVTPKGGGLGIYAAFVVTACLLPEGRGADLLAILVLGGGIVLLGLVDDRWPLPWQSRLGIQAAAAVAFIAWRRTSNPTFPYSLLHTPYSVLFWVIAVLWLVGLVNAFNMLDNMDALSGGVAWIAAGMFGLALLLRQGGGWDWRPLAGCLMLMGALSGFLWFNRPPARIFMGDAGSTFLGFFLGARALEGGLVDAAQPQTWAVPLCILAVPLYDMASVVTLRLWQGRSPFHADKQHLSHRLVALGLSSPAAVRVIYLFGLASGVGGLVLYEVSSGGAVLVGVQLLCWWLAVAAVEYFRHFRAPAG
jgi:UDP-GlcNAc:undecaprenyl-phosphate GlcNAc-1-phosphate transferase